MTTDKSRKQPQIWSFSLKNTSFTISKALSKNYEKSERCEDAASLQSLSTGFSFKIFKIELANCQQL